MSAQAGNEILKSDAKVDEQPTSQSAIKPEKKGETGINWWEVLRRSSGKVGETSYTQVKEEIQRKEAKVSPEALDLAKDSFCELVYLLLKNPASIPNGEQLKGKITQLNPTLIQLFNQSETSLSAVDVVEKIQQEIEAIFNDDTNLNEGQKRMREVRRQQVVMMGLAFQEYKMQVIIRAYNVSKKKEKTGIPDEEKRLIQEAKKNLERPLNVLVFDEKGNIIPQGPELSEEDYVNAHFEDQPVSFLNRILGRTEEAQRKKAAQEYQRYRELLEKQERQRQAQRRLEFEIQTNEKAQFEDGQKFLLKELGLIDNDKIKETQAVLPKIMAEIRATLTLRREILAATGVSGDKFWADLIQLSSSMIPSLDTLNSESLAPISEITQRIQNENAQRVREELEKAERQSTISQLRIKEEKLEERLEKIKEKEAKEKGKEAQLVGEGQNSLVDQIKSQIENKLNEIKRQRLLEGQDFDTLLTRVDELNLKIAALEAELEERRDDFERLKKLREELGQLRRMAATKSITYGQGENTQTQIINEEGVMKMIAKIESEINTLANGSEGLDNKKKTVAQLKSEKAKLDIFLKIEISINGETRTIKEWLEEARELKSRESQKGGGESSTGEGLTKEEVERQLYGVRALIRYYSEDELSKREERILQNKEQQPNGVFTDENLAAIESRNPKLYELLPKNEDGGVDIARVKGVLLVLYQVFGNEFIYPDDPNAPEVRGRIAILQAMGDLGHITSIEDFDKKMRELVNRYLKGELELGSNNKQIKPEVTTQQRINSPELPPVEATLKEKAEEPKPPKIMEETQDDKKT